jgi:hypothetical protein
LFEEEAAEQPTALPPNCAEVRAAKKPAKWPRRKLASATAVMIAVVAHGAPELVEAMDSGAVGAQALALVISLNVQRRDLTAGQRAIVAARALDIMPERRGGNQSGKSSHIGKSRDLVAQQFKVSDKSVQQGKAILTEAPDLVEQIEARALTPPRRSAPGPAARSRDWRPAPVAHFSKQGPASADEYHCGNDKPARICAPADLFSPERFG